MLLGLALLSLFCLGTSPASAQEEPRRLVGTVVDAGTGVPLSGATIVVEDGNARAVSRAAGLFTLDGVPRGPGLLRVTLFGYEELLVPVNGTAPDSLTIQLQVRPIPIEGIDVVGSSEVSLNGVVVDATSREGLPWARVRLGQYRVEPADESGAFRIDRVVAGRYLLLVERLGYESAYVPVTLAGTPDALIVSLEPDSILLRGIEEMTGRLQSRRGAYGFGTVRGLDEARLYQTPARDAMQLLATDGKVTVTPCDPPNGASTCVAVGAGRVSTPRVFIDEFEVQCGLSALATFAPSDFFLVEVYDRGAHIRAYTHDFMDRTGRKNRALIPADLLPPSIGAC